VQTRLQASRSAAVSRHLRGDTLPLGRRLADARPTPGHLLGHRSAAASHREPVRNRQLASQCLAATRPLFRET
jgi:hypothetical protein